MIAPFILFDVALDPNTSLTRFSFNDSGSCSAADGRDVTQEDVDKINAKLQELVQAKSAVTGKNLPWKQALEYMEANQQPFAGQLPMEGRTNMTKRTVDLGGIFARVR